MPADPRAAAITERVTLDLMDHLDDLDKHGRTYIREYVESILGKPTTHRPKYHFHPKLAELVRDLAQDAALIDRRPIPSDRVVSSVAANNDRPLTSQEQYVQNRSVTRSGGRKSRGAAPHHLTSPSGTEVVVRTSGSPRGKAAA